MYNYNEHYEKAIQEGADLLAKAKKDFAQMKKEYREDILKEKLYQLETECNNQLLLLKNNFIKEAKEGLQVDMQNILEKREKAQNNKTKEDRILEQLEYQQEVDQYKAMIEIATENTFPEILNQIQNEKVFNVVKAAAYQLAENKQAILSIKWTDKELQGIQANMNSVQYLESRVLEPILPININDIHSYITNTNMSDFYFSGGVK
mgnify:CR=1 FL=1